MSYGEVFTKIKKEAVTATKELVKNGIWKQDVSDQDKAIIMGLWVQKMSEIYGMETPKFYFVTGKEGEEMHRITGGGTYTPFLNTIHLYKKASLTTLLHEFRHAMQYQTNIKLYRNDKEEDARAWSVSLFKTATPNSYNKAVENGILHFS